MKTLYLISILFLLLSSCKKTDSNPLSSTDSTTTGLDIASKLKQWSLYQPQPYVICWVGDTSGGKIYDIGDFITNIVFNKNIIQGEFRDSLIIDTTYANSFEYNRSKTQLKSLLDSISLSISEEQMSTLLRGLGLKLRMMRYDSLTYTLNLKLLQWARHKYPPQVIWSGFYSIVNEGPNAGGYASPWFTYRGVQNLQYFTRKVNHSNLENIVSLVDTSLTFDQLHSLMLPIAPIQFHDTWWGPE